METLPSTTALCILCTFSEYNSLLLDWRTALISATMDANAKLTHVLVRASDLNPAEIELLALCVTPSAAGLAQIPL